MSDLARPPEDSQYGPEFYGSTRAAAVASARAVVPVLLRLLDCRSVVDLGCGEGHWLQAFVASGVSDVLGVDAGVAWRAGAAIPAEHLIDCDLRTPFRWHRRFELVLSLEAAEHLEEGAARTLVETIVGLGDVVVFSAAVPQQGGQGHVNEQWPSYWRERFLEHGYVCIDAIRSLIWKDNSVAWWYRQNMLLFVARGVVESDARFGELARHATAPLDVVHPDLFAETIGALESAWREVSTARAERDHLRARLQSTRT